MSSYFDERQRLVSDLCQRYDGDDLVRHVGDLERAMIDEISLVTGDREFPDDLRERIQSAIATCTVHHPRGIIGLLRNDKAIHYLLVCRASVLLAELHSLFHEVASRRHETRYGRLSDNPHGILYRRDAHDGTDLTARFVTVQETP